MESAAASERAAKSFRGAAAMGRKYGPYSLAGTMQADMVGKSRKKPFKFVGSLLHFNVFIL